MTLTEFLLARIADDEARARGSMADYPDLEPVYDGQWDEARVRAECEAKRRIVARFTGDLHMQWDDGYEAAKIGPVILGDLAAVYSDHPDYREEWRP